MECGLCNYCTNDPREFEEHLLRNHFMSYYEYCEFELSNDRGTDSYCYRCNRYRYPLTPILPEHYYLPCYKCFLENYKKQEKQEMVDSILRNIKSYFDIFLGDRYLQLFLVDGIYPKNTISHGYLEFKKLLGNLNLPSRNDLWLLDWRPGYPKVLSSDNIDGIRIVNLTQKYNVISDKTLLQIGRFKILIPESVSYEKQHFSRYNILNTNSERKTKRIKVGDNCYKLYKSTVSGDNSSILRVVDINTGEKVKTEDISYQDLVIIKLAILRNKTYFRLIISILQELIRSIRVVRDSVFLRNTVTIDPDKKLDLNFSWLPNRKNQNKNTPTINISIL